MISGEVRGSAWTPFHLIPFLGSSIIYLTLVPDTSLILEAKRKLARLMRAFVPQDAPMNHYFIMEKVIRA